MRFHYQLFVLFIYLDGHYTKTNRQTNKHKTELQRTAPGAKVSCRKFSYVKTCGLWVVRKRPKIPKKAVDG